MLKSSFIQHRNTMDDIIAIVETIYSLIHSRGKKGLLLLKLDLQKVYGQLKWRFIRNYLKLFGHPKQIIIHISLCFHFTYLSINWHDNTR